MEARRRPRVGRRGLASIEYLIILATVILPLIIVINHALLPALVESWHTSAVLIQLPFP